MRLYRVFPWDPSAAMDRPGGALFIPRSSTGSFDNPDLFQGLYCAASPEAAIGERFARLRAWRPATFQNAKATFALATIDTQDLALADLGHVPTLTKLGIQRVTDVVTRDRAVSQPVAARAYHLGAAHGLSWWSAYVADWTNVLLWDTTRLTLVGQPEPLSVAHPAVAASADTLPRSVVLR